MRFIDTRIIALYQALVNWSQRKPSWWGEQCAYLLVVAVGLAAIRMDFTLPIWVRIVVLMGLLLMAGLIWLESRTPVLWEWQRQNNPILWRMAFLVLLLMDIWALFWGLPRAESICLSLAFTSYHYLLCCEDPPPPRRRTSTKLSTEGAS